MSDAPPSRSPRKRFIRPLILAGVALLLYFVWPHIKPAYYSDGFASRVLHLLPTGWIDFLQRVAPEISLSVAAIAFTSLVAGIAFLLVLWLGRRLSSAWSWRSTTAIVLAPLLLFIIALSATGTATRASDLAKDPAPIIGGRMVSGADMHLRAIHYIRQARLSPPASRENP